MLNGPSAVGVCVLGEENSELTHIDTLFGPAAVFINTLDEVCCIAACYFWEEHNIIGIYHMSDGGASNASLDTIDVLRVKLMV